MEIPTGAIELKTRDGNSHAKWIVAAVGSLILAAAAAYAVGIARTATDAKDCCATLTTRTAVMENDDKNRDRRIDELISEVKALVAEIRRQERRDRDSRR